MTKDELRECFHQGHTLEWALPLVNGQDCLIYKAEQFRTDDTIIYIPDMTLNNITVFSVPVDEDVDYTLDRCYTGADFVKLCEGDEALAYRLFCYCDWQHPSSAFPEVDYDDEEDKAWVKQAYETAKKEGRVYVKAQ